MYRIMTLVKSYDNPLSSLYKFLTETDETGEENYYEAKTLQELDAKVEEMLNGDYAKKDFVIVEIKDYNIDADIVKNVIE